jgi:hypothetical protein
LQSISTAPLPVIAATGMPPPFVSTYRLYRNASARQSQSRLLSYRSSSIP